MTNKKVIVGFSALCVAIVALFVVISSGCASTANLDQMKQSYKNYLLETTSTTKTEAKSIDEIKANIKTQEISGVETYYFSNVDYKTDNVRSKWPASEHVSNLLNYAITAEKTNNAELKEVAVKLANYWVFNNFRNTNWWNNDLGARNNLASAALFILDDMDEKAKVALMGQLHDATFKYHSGLKTHLGANLFDYADVSFKTSLLENDESAFNEMFNRIQDEIVVGNKEGFQTDGSFFQHGKQIQIASYGKSIVRLGKLLSIFSDGNKLFSNDKMNIITNYITKGLTYTTHKGYTNYAAVSREYSRSDSLDATKNSYSQLKTYLGVSNCPNKDDISKFIDDVKDRNSTFSGVKFFDVAKMITANIDDVYLSYKGSDETLTNTECVNDENLLGLNLSYGTNTVVMDDGKEYFNISPLWQYDYLPGTTSIALDEGQEDSQITDIVQGANLYSDPLYEQTLPAPDDQGNYVYGGGMDETNNVACLMEKSNHHGENKFTVTCFTCQDGMVLVGSDLEYTGEVTGVGKYFTTDRTLHTTLDQCMYKGSHSLSDDKKTLTHGNVVYSVLDDNQIDVQVADQTGTWQRNNPQLEKPKEAATGKTLLAAINYNSNKAKGYAYSIQPVSRQDKKFEIIDTGDSNIHAVKLPDGKIATAFYHDGSFNYDGKDYSGSKGEFKVF